jgi:hypothetical protein
VSSLSNDKDLVRSDAYVLFYRHRYLPLDPVDPCVNELTQQNTTPVSMDIYEDAVTMESTQMGDIIDLLK